MSRRYASSREAVRAAKALGTPTGDYLARVLRRHRSVGVWTAEHQAARLRFDESHEVCDPVISRRCLRQCVIEDAACETCGQGTLWPCVEARDALRLLNRLARDAK